ncbi:hypothetical protein [Pseudolysinimonas sp.]|uniref:hypothetical protein n=1 Tax=Pseudolysinimonas sp. TaxID=2680009 RepID=UPI003F7ECD1A
MSNLKSAATYHPGRPRHLTIVEPAQPKLRWLPDPETIADRATRIRARRTQTALRFVALTATAGLGLLVIWLGIILATAAFDSIIGA